MRFYEFKIVEQAGIYIIGDSHAKALGGPNNSAVNGARLASIARQAAQVPNGSTVVMSGGHNDVAAGTAPQQIASQVSQIKQNLEQKDCTVFYILFPEGTDNPNQESMAPTREAISSSINVDYDLEGKGLASDGQHATPSAYRNIPLPQGGDQPAGSSQSEDGDLEKGPPYPAEQFDAVKDMQRKLEDLGYSVGSTGIDGKYGPRTARAVGAFKTDNDISTSPNTMTQSELQRLATAEPVEDPTPTNNARIDARVLQGDPNFEAPGYPSGLSQRDIEDMIRDEARLRSMDPDVAVRIFRAEGAGSYQSQIPRRGRGSLGGREASFGPYQMYIGGGMGNEYQEDTGRDLATDNTPEGIENQIRYALDQAVVSSWQPWYGRGPAGVGRYEGLRGARQVRNWS